MSAQVIKILFVCTGNICRSPTAEGVFRHLAEKEGLSARFQLDSAGTDSYHEGHKPDARAVKVAKNHGVSIDDQKARRMTPEDYFNFDYIFAMDGGHLYEIQQNAPEGRRAEIGMFLSAASDIQETEVPDPWYGSEKNFETVYALINTGAKALLEKMKEDHRL